MIQVTGPTTVLVGLLTGVFLLLYGVRLVSDTVQQAFKGRVKQALPQLPKSSFVMFSIGVIATGLLQSSSAMASLLVELSSADVLPLTSAIVVLLGANVGSTLVVQLLVFNVTNYAIYIVGVSAVIALFTHRSKVIGRLGRALFAISLVILGLAIIKASSDPIAGNQLTKTVLEALSVAPLALVLTGIVLAMLLNSSAAAIGIVLPLAGSGALSPTSALILMLGANVGTTLLSMFASLNDGSLAGRRLALTHCGTKLIGAIVVLSMIQPLNTLLFHILPNPVAEVALTHLGFNLALAAIFTPLASPLASVMRQILPDKHSLPVELPTLDPQALELETPAVAQGLAARETLRMADIVTNMLEVSVWAFQEQPDTIQTRIEAMDDELDELDKAIKGYLTDNRLHMEAATDSLLTIVSELEAMGDVINRPMMALARRKARDGISFSDEGGKDLVLYHHLLKGAFQQVLAALASHNPTLAKDFLARKQKLQRTKRDLHLRHIYRLRANIPETVRSSAIHTDLLHAMSTILAHISNIAHAIQDMPINSYVLPYDRQENSYMVPQDEPVSSYLTPHDLLVRTYQLAEDVQTDQLPFPTYPIHTDLETHEYPLLSTGQFIVVRGNAHQVSA